MHRLICLGCRETTSAELPPNTPSGQSEPRVATPSVADIRWRGLDFGEFPDLIEQRLKIIAGQRDPTASIARRLEIMVAVQFPRGINTPSFSRFPRLPAAIQRLRLDKDGSPGLATLTVN